ncbi:hypothetical protein Ae201684P_010829 [Aphanomyces euteiches]|nr:hypothetical protein Ae201684P_010829 [Aphanomyces euteiches]
MIPNSSKCVKNMSGALAPCWVKAKSQYGSMKRNVFTARTKARSKRGTRAVNQRGSSQKGINLHIIGAISTNNFLYCTAKRGAYKGQHANDWLRDMLRQAKAHFGALGDLLVICDNSPCHSRYFDWNRVS